MYLIGLTGGIASGKTVVAKRLAELGAVHIDADQVAREVVEPGTPALALIAKEFGPTVIAPDGSLDRPALGAVIFSDAQKRLALNAITHPAVWRRTGELIAAATAANPDAVIVYDVPLLVEASADRPLSFDLIVVVHADSETRIARMVDLRGMSREAATHRLNSQATDAERLAIADVVIDSTGSLEHTVQQADELWAMASAAAHATPSAVSKQAK
ncbi:MAG: dephospho-CoA kinase [Rhodoglobus sp.]